MGVYYRWRDQFFLAWQYIVDSIAKYGKYFSKFLFSSGNINFIFIKNVVAMNFPISN